MKQGLSCFPFPEYCVCKVQSVSVSSNCMEQTPSWPSTYSCREGAKIPCSITEGLVKHPDIIMKRRIKIKSRFLFSIFILILSAGIRVRLHSGRNILSWLAIPCSRQMPYYHYKNLQTTQYLDYSYEALMTSNEYWHKCNHNLGYFRIRSVFVYK